MDGIKEASQYSTEITQKTEGFFLKGSNSLEWGMKDRLARIFSPVSGRTVMLAFDHGYIMGPTSGLERMDMGRNIFQAGDPIAMIQAVRAVVHDREKPEKAYDLYNTLKKQS